jgi:hypothetical protein
LPSTPAAQPLYELIDRAEAQAMGPLAAVTLRELAAAPRLPGPAPGGNGNGSPAAAPEPAPGKSPA